MNYRQKCKNFVNSHFWFFMLYNADKNQLFSYRQYKKW